MASRCTVNPDLFTPRGLAVMVTRRCNMTCGHCSVESSPRAGDTEPTEQELTKLIHDAAAAGIPFVNFTGGEPMLREDIVLRMIRLATRLGVAATMTTNGFWGKSAARARKTVSELRKAGLSLLTVSYDRYHAEYLGPQAVKNIEAAAAPARLPMNINITCLADSPELGEYEREFRNLKSARLRFYDIQPLGRARNLQPAELHARLEGFCSASGVPAITEDGRMTACNGPSYFDKVESPLVIGDLKETSLADLLKMHSQDNVLQTIRTLGPGALRDMLMEDPEFEFMRSETYAGQCDLCRRINNNPKAVARLRTVLADSRVEAERIAKVRVINAAEQSLQLGRDYTNGPAMARALFQRITRGEWAHNHASVLGRADLDWRLQLEYQAGIGLARHVTATLEDPEVKRWFPEFARAEFRKKAMNDALRLLAHRQVHELLAREAANLQQPPVLLKGCAMAALEAENGLEEPFRVPGDVDILVPDAQAAMAFRNRLLDAGCQGERNAPRSGPHHLAAVSYRGIPIEIHTRIMPSFWGLPEDELIATARPLRNCPTLTVMSPEAMIVHETAHLATHLFAYGMKFAYDLWRFQRMSINVDWQQVTAWGMRCASPRAFALPLRILSDGLGVLAPLPATVTSDLAHIKWDRRLENFAFRQLYMGTDNPEDMNPFTRNGAFLLIFPGLFAKTRYISQLLGKDASESRRTALTSQGNQSYRMLPVYLREALRDVRQFLRA